MPSYSNASTGEEQQELHTPEAPLRFSFDLTPSAVERTRLLSLVPYPLVRGYLWFRGWVAVGLSALERSFKFLLVGLLGFIAGYSFYSTSYAAHVRAYWQPHTAPAAAVRQAADIPAVLDTPIVDRPAIAAASEPVEQPTDVVTPPKVPVAAPVRPAPKATPKVAPKTTPRVTPPAVTAAVPPVLLPAESVGESRDPSIPLFNLNRSPNDPILEAAPLVTYDERPVSERMLAFRQDAAAENKLILFYFSADWCLPCKVMEGEVFTNSDVARTLRDQYVFVKRDIETLDGYELKQYLKVASLPGFVIMDRYGRELDRAGAAMPLSRFRTFLRADGAVYTAATKPGPRLR